MKYIIKAIVERSHTIPGMKFLDWTAWKLKCIFALL